MVLPTFFLLLYNSFDDFLTSPVNSAHSWSLSGLADPYVKGQLGPYRFRTKIQRKTLCPQWREEFKIPIVTWESENVLAIEVRDKDTFVDDVLGFVFKFVTSVIWLVCCKFWFCAHSLNEIWCVVLYAFTFTFPFAPFLICTNPI